VQATKRVKDPRKQRKRLYNAPAHVRHKLMAAPLSPELVKSRGVKSLPVRKGDTVRIVRGDHIGFEGKINKVDLKRYRITLEGLTREKVDGTNIFVSVHPSKVMIRNLKLDDKWRKAIVEFKKEQAPLKKEKKVKVVAKRPKKAKEEKPAEEEAEVQEKPAEKAAKPAPKRLQKKPAAQKTKEEKPKAATAVKEKLPEKKPAAKPKTARKKPAAAKKEKTVAKKKTEPAAEKGSLKKEKKPKAVKKAPAKRKTAASKKEGGK
jgi:large subunit ribosomal protein L24